MAGGPDDEAAATPPRDTYMPKPPSKAEVDQVSREQAMVTDEWAAEPAGGSASATPKTGPDGGKG
jgi:hypothetical protein